MKSAAKLPTPAEHDRIVRQLRQQVEERQQGYRDRALKLFPHVCGNCGREFSGKRLRELTVHHKDHDYTNNPPDGSNWELLCLYCHDHEHDKLRLANYSGGARQEDRRAVASGFNPFANLDQLVKPVADPTTEEGEGGQPE